MIDWIPCDKELPPVGMVVDTKIDDKQGCRNVTTLKRNDRLWFLPDGSMYVYYTPTHWRQCRESEKEADDLIKLVRRDKTYEAFRDGVKVADLPSSQLESYVRRLKNAGYRVAILNHD